MNFGLNNRFICNIMTMFREFIVLLQMITKMKIKVALDTSVSCRTSRNEI